MKRRSFLGFLGAAAAAVPLAPKLLAHGADDFVPLADVPLDYPPAPAASGGIVYHNGAILRCGSAAVMIIESVNLAREAQPIRLSEYNDQIEFVIPRPGKLDAHGLLLSHAALEASMHSGRPQHWSIRTKDGCTWDFQAYLSMCEVGIGPGEPTPRCQLRLLLCSNPTYTVTTR